MLYQIQSYIKFLLKSRNQHGVHSPFVYDLITKCFYDKSDYEEYTVLDKYRATLLNDTDTIAITDLGAGSRVFKTHIRKVSDIARYAGISKRRQRLLFRITKYFSAEDMLELGTSLGMATAAMSLGSTTSKITTIEACEATTEKTATYLRSIAISNVNYVVATFDTFLKEDNSSYDLIFIDGDHSKEGTLRYFNALRKRATNTTLIILDDIYWSRGMTEAWQEIVASEDVTLSIDIFYWGLVFFRKEQKKEHFTIRL